MNQTNLREPEKTDWENAYKGTKYVAPPVPVDPSGKAIPFGAIVRGIKEADPDDGYLNYQVDLELADHPGVTTRAWISAKPFMKRDASGELVAMKGNPNRLGSFLKSAGLQAKPQTNAEYQAAIRTLPKDKRINVTIDWVARNKENNETVRGYFAFPKDEATGNRKPILRAGDLAYEVNKKGDVIDTMTIQSEVLFANAQVKYFMDPNRK